VFGSSYFYIKTKVNRQKKKHSLSEEKLLELITFKTLTFPTQTVSNPLQLALHTTQN
jgi:hypothetical protein